jgi:hypothetical protein
MMSRFRAQIVLDYAKWTALSATRSGAPIKSRGDVYSLLDAVTFGEVLSPGPRYRQAGNEDQTVPYVMLWLERKKTFDSPFA